MPDPTAQTEPLTIGQRIVADWESSIFGEPCDLAEVIDKAIEASAADMRERAAVTADGFRCGACGMDGKSAAAIRALSANPEETDG